MGDWSHDLEPRELPPRESGDSLRLKLLRRQYDEMKEHASATDLRAGVLLDERDVLAAEVAELRRQIDLHAGANLVLADRLAAAVGVLRWIEWEGGGPGELRCAYCDQLDHEGHASCCKLAAVLAVLAVAAEGGDSDVTA